MIKIFQKIKGSVVIYALYFALLVSLICTFVITKNYNSKRKLILLEDYDLCRRSVASVINYCLVNNKAPLNIVVQKTLFKNKETSFVKRKWGMFEQIIAKATTKNDTIINGGFYGSLFNNQKCLFLRENNSALSITGNTIIKGDVFLPKKGIKQAFVEGKNFSGEKMIYGNTETSNNNLPKLSEEHLKRIQENLKGNFNSLKSNLNIPLVNDSVFNSFFNETLIFENKKIFLANSTYSGNIIFYSHNEILIDSSCHLDNVILFGKKITIQNGVKGNFQTFASDSLIVEKNVSLSYPSTLGVVNSLSSYISIDSNVVVEGSVIHKSENNKSNTIISKYAKVKGIVYNDNLLTLNGTVKGKVIANKFYLKTASTRYTNLLMDATIDITNIPNLASFLVEDNEAKKVLMKTIF